MNKAFYHLHHHIKQHHKKYVFGFFGGFAVAKLFLLVLGLTVVQYGHSAIFADNQGECTRVGQYYTGEYFTGEYLSKGTLTGCETIAAYWSGGSLNESGEQIGGEYIAESQTGCTVIGEEMTGGYLTGGYRTGGTLVCTQPTPIPSPAVIVTSLIGNGICESGDIVWNKPVSGSFVRDIFDISWLYSGSDCLLSGLTLQLRDHNAQWIDIATIASGATSMSFNSASLYSFQNSGLYHIFGTNSSGEQIYVYTGQYSGSYSRLFSGYKFRLLTPSQITLNESNPFTIDNQVPTLTGISLLASGGAVTGYVSKSGVVTLSFVASEQLSGVQVALLSGMAPSSWLVSGLLYSYTWNLSSLFAEGALTARISFADLAGNTGATSYTSSTIFDISRPIVNGFVFAETAEGLRMNFSASESITYKYGYQTAGSSPITGNISEYLTAHYLNFSGIQRDLLYTFTVSTFDRAGNTRVITGDVVRTNLGIITSHIFVVPVADETILSGSLASLAVILKAEVSKFNTCKNALSYSPVELTINKTVFVLQMPSFKKTQVKTLVNAFTLFVLDKVKNNHTIDADEITILTKKFNNFLVVLKLLRDDDNACKQNLSNYHISQFKRTLQEYKISLD